MCPPRIHNLAGKTQVWQNNKRTSKTDSRPEDRQEIRPHKLRYWFAPNTGARLRRCFLTFIKKLFGNTSVGSTHLQLQEVGLISPLTFFLYAVHYSFGVVDTITGDQSWPNGQPNDQIGTHLVNQFCQKSNLVNPFGQPTISPNLVIQFGQVQFGQNGPYW